MSFVRDIFTGELVEREQQEPGVIFRGCLPPWAKENRRHRKRVWTGKDTVCKPLSIKPEEATAERVTEYNEKAQHHGTGAYYTPDGVCHLPTRASRSKELRRRGMQDNDAGYSDYAGN